MVWQTRHIGRPAPANINHAIRRRVAIAILFTVLGDVPAVLADRDSPQYHRGACEGAYPGWLRGLVDGYNGVADASATGGSVSLAAAPVPDSITSADERQGYKEGLQAGFAYGVAYGVQLGKSARTDETDANIMNRATEGLSVYIQSHCGALIPYIDWDRTFLNASGTATATSLTAAQLAMHNAATANQLAVGAEASAQEARDAEAKGDHPVALANRLAAQSAAQMAAGFADMARSQAAAGREEAVQAIIDAQAAAERARKAADSAGG
ncbi:hypothetical protein [Pseudorhizobium flavum]|uniref:Uncharacterized protein n=1 Tax=Pseudorhizobium flavum TaxID=1335061 RepID=A0A7X0DCH2_9HYPH|nr:hypothetical protein [Pseudorhizobium flavum]MBB6179615.1 hypothetical protein [Pseudorhizobium flavum]CAD6596178.1 hypothetical protein RFYW14_00233 [Pseudorhizobium flavum]